MTGKAKLESPFQNIAVAFSGGGFRAAAFSLGTLSYLDRVGLTSEIRFLSSASGGTITNLMYGSSLKRGISFNDFYTQMLASLNGDQLLERALIILNDDAQWPEHDSGKERNLINSFARAYDSALLFDGGTLSVFWNNTKRGNLEVCVNATDFYRGLSFRFQTDGTSNPKQVIGNFYLKFNVSHLETVKKLKLADVLAASSCFPAGFEPICYPCDFSHPGLDVNELKEAVLYTDYNEQVHPLNFAPPANNTDPKQKNYIDSFGLMDGGIIDNQGLGSLMLADEKRRNNKANPNPFNLMIITDVASYFMDNYEPPTLAKPDGWRGKSIGFFIKTVKAISKWPSKALIISSLLLAADVIIGLIDPNPVKAVICGVCFGVLIVIAAASLMVITRMKGMIKNIQTFDLEQELITAAKMKNIFSASIIGKLTRYLSITKFNVFEQLLKARLSSVLSMVMDVNLKQVRRLIYQSFYANTDYDNRRMPNFIYELSLHNQASRTNRINDPKRLTWTATKADKAILLEDLQLLRPIAENARLFGTTLWFESNPDGEQMLKDVVTAGQFTTCMNLVEYIISLRRKNVVFDPDDDKKVDQLMQQLLADLNTFKNSPYFMF